MLRIHMMRSYACALFFDIKLALGFREFYALLLLFGVFMTRRGYVLSEM